jgi:hypothetical protein
MSNSSHLRARRPLALDRYRKPHLTPTKSVRSPSDNGAMMTTWTVPDNWETADRGLRPASSSTVSGYTRSSGTGRASSSALSSYSKVRNATPEPPPPVPDIPLMAKKILDTGRADPTTMLTALTRSITAKVDSKAYKAFEMDRELWLFAAIKFLGPFSYRSKRAGIVPAPLEPCELPGGPRVLSLHESPGKWHWT